MTDATLRTRISDGEHAALTIIALGQGECLDLLPALPDLLHKVNWVLRHWDAGDADLLRLVQAGGEAVVRYATLRRANVVARTLPAIASAQNPA